MLAADVDLYALVTTYQPQPGLLPSADLWAAHSGDAAAVARVHGRVTTILRRSPQQDGIGNLTVATRLA